jgi:hypothetical protein
VRRRGRLCDVDEDEVQLCAEAGLGQDEIGRPQQQQLLLDAERRSEEMAELRVA